MDPASDATFQAIRRLLADRGISFREVTHEPTFTSQESAAARGEPMYVGAKALLVKTDDDFRLFVLPADEKLDSAAVKRAVWPADPPLRTLGRHDHRRARR
jgi:Ala-tRNA(Pro) deacylase